MALRSVTLRSATVVVALGFSPACARDNPIFGISTGAAGSGSTQAADRGSSTTGKEPAAGTNPQTEPGGEGETSGDEPAFECEVSDSAVFNLQIRAGEDKVEPRCGVESFFGVPVLGDGILMLAACAGPCVCPGNANNPYEFELEPGGLIPMDFVLDQADCIEVVVIGRPVADGSGRCDASTFIVRLPLSVAPLFVAGSQAVEPVEGGIGISLWGPGEPCADEPSCDPEPAKYSLEVTDRTGETKTLAEGEDFVGPYYPAAPMRTAPSMRVTNHWSRVDDQCNERILWTAARVFQ